MSEATTTSGPGPGAGILGVLPDQRLARRAADGDERAFAAIFQRYHQRLYRFCLAIVADPEDAQDALQNTMVKVLRALPGERRAIDLKPWLYRIAHNESIEVLRRRRETRELDVELPAAGPGLAEEAGARERLRRLLADLGELPERQRQALVMRELAGLGFAEIGAALETTPAVARQTLYEARVSLRQMDEGREMSCATVTRALSDGDGRVTRRRDIRSHLRACADCRRFREEIEGRRRDLTALSPLPAAAAAGLLHGLLGHGGGGGGGGLAAGIGGGAAKSVGATTALKGAAAVAVIAAVGVTAADRGGVIDVGLPGGAASRPASAPPDAALGGGSKRLSGTSSGAVGGRLWSIAVSARARVLRGPPGGHGTAAAGTVPGNAAAEVGGSAGRADAAAPRLLARPPARQGSRKVAPERLPARTADGVRAQGRRTRLLGDEGPRRPGRDSKPPRRRIRRSPPTRPARAPKGARAARRGRHKRANAGRRALRGSAGRRPAGAGRRPSRSGRGKAHR